MPKLTDDTWQAIRGQWETGASDASLAARYGVSRQTIKRRAAAHQWQRDDACEGAGERSPEGRRANGSDGGDQPILDRAQLAFKQQAEWAPIDALQADMVAALQSIRTRLQARVASASPGRQNRKATGAQDRAPGLDPRVTLDDVLKWATTWAALYDKAASGLHKAQDGERRAHGFDSRMQQHQTAEDAEAIESCNEMWEEMLVYVDQADQTYREQEERQETDANDPSKLTDGTWQSIRDQWETGAGDASLAMRYFLSLQAIERRAAAHQWQRADAPEGLSRGAPGRPILDRPQLAVKHQAEWAALDAIQADVLAALQGIRTRLQARAAGALPGRPNRTSAPGAQTRAPDSDPRVTLDDLLTRATTWAALYQKAASGRQKAQDGERRAHGFDFRMPQQQIAEDEEAMQSLDEELMQLLAYVERARWIRVEQEERQKANAAEAHDG